MKTILRNKNKNYYYIDIDGIVLADNDGNTVVFETYQKAKNFIKNK